MNVIITMAAVRRHIKKCKRQNRRYDWLGFTENKELSREVESLFTLWNPCGYSAYNWVNGNEKLRKREQEGVTP